MPEHAPDRPSSSDVERARAASRDVGPPIVLLLLTQGSLLVLDPDGTASTWQAAWSLLPLVPGLWLAWAQARVLRRADEYQRGKELEALALGFAVVIVLAMAGGLLEAGGLGDPRQSLQAVTVGGLLTWVVARTLLLRSS